MAMGERVKGLVLLDLGERSWQNDELPLHVTVAPPFSLEQAATREVGEALSRSLEGVEPFVIHGMGEDYFGPNHDIRVRKIGGRALHNLHEKVIDVIQNFSIVDMQYAGSHYAPYSSYKGDTGVGAGEEFLVDRVTFATRRQIGARQVWQPARLFELRRNGDDETATR